MRAQTSDPSTRFQPPAREGTVTYFIQAEAGGPIKIGRSLDQIVDKRLATLQGGNPEKLRITKVMAGDHEAKLHYRFRDLRITGEWFYPHPRLAVFAEAVGQDIDLDAPAVREAYKRGYGQGWHEATRQLAKESAARASEAVRLSMMSLGIELGVTAKAERAVKGAQKGRKRVPKAADFQVLSEPG